MRMSAVDRPRPPVRMGIYPVTLAAGNWHDILTALELAQEVATREGLAITREAFERVHGQVLDQVRQP